MFNEQMFYKYIKSAKERVVRLFIQQVRRNVGGGYVMQGSDSLVC